MRRIWHFLLKHLRINKILEKQDKILRSQDNILRLQTETLYAQRFNKTHAHMFTRSQISNIALIWIQHIVS